MLASSAAGSWNNLSRQVKSNDKAAKKTVINHQKKLVRYFMREVEEHKKGWRHTNADNCKHV